MNIFNSLFDWQDAKTIQRISNPTQNRADVKAYAIFRYLSLILCIIFLILSLYTFAGYTDFLFQHLFGVDYANQDISEAFKRSFRIQVGMILLLFGAAFQMIYLYVSDAYICRKLIQDSIHSPRPAEEVTE